MPKRKSIPKVAASEPTTTPPTEKHPDDLEPAVWDGKVPFPDPETEGMTKEDFEKLQKKLPSQTEDMDAALRGELPEEGGEYLDWPGSVEELGAWLFEEVVGKFSVSESQLARIAAKFITVKGKHIKPASLRASGNRKKNSKTNL
ncbi:MAG TPA: hypothetical protein VMU24_02605 [Candidatus Acidoferrales bacterium]|nr:hypothetical protein [Candidatus Acidoferrales bacterium]